MEYLRLTVLVMTTLLLPLTCTMPCMDGEYRVEMDTRVQQCVSGDWVDVTCSQPNSDGIEPEHPALSTATVSIQATPTPNAYSHESVSTDSPSAYSDETASTNSVTDTTPTPTPNTTSDGFTQTHVTPAPTPGISTEATLSLIQLSPYMAAIVFLFCLLVISSIGWTCTCILMRRRIHNLHKKSNHSNQKRGQSNPIQFMGPNQSIGYRSMGHDYERMRAKEGAGSDYHLLSREQPGINGGGLLAQQSVTSELSPDYEYNKLGETDGCHDYHVLEESTDIDCTEQRRSADYDHLVETEDMANQGRSVVEAPSPAPNYQGARQNTNRTAGNYHTLDGPNSTRGEAAPIRNDYHILECPLQPTSTVTEAASSRHDYYVLDGPGIGRSCDEAARSGDGAATSGVPHTTSLEITRESITSEDYQTLDSADILESWQSPDTGGNLLGNDVDSHPQDYEEPVSITQQEFEGQDRDDY